MPARIVVHLARGPETVPPPHTGPAVNAAFLAALRNAGEAELASAMHTTKPPKPYALTPLIDERNRRTEASSASARFEVGVLADPLTGRVLQALTSTESVRVARCLYQVVKVELVAAEPYPVLLKSARPTDRWTLDIRTPVAYSTAREEGARRIRPFPEPEWVLGDLYRRWHAFAPHTPLSDGVPEAIERHLEVADYRLTMAPHLVKAGVPMVRGSIGTITYRLADPGRLSGTVRAGVDALLAFGAYAGIGDRTVVGMGYTIPSPHGTGR